MHHDPSQPTRPNADRRRTVSRVLLAVSTVALLTATHWPGLAIEGPIDRTDLVIHAGVFAVWGALLALATGLRLWALLVVGVLVAAFDETTQPLFNRVFDWTDLGADAVGVLLGASGVRIVRSRAGADTLADRA